MLACQHIERLVCAAGINASVLTLRTLVKGAFYEQTLLLLPCPSHSQL